MSFTPSTPEEIDSYRDRFVGHLSQTVPGRKEFVVADAKGCTVTTADGRSYLDMTSGIGVANVGHCHPQVVAAIQSQAARYSHVNVYGRFVVPEQVELGGNPVACAAGIAAFDVLADGVIDHAREAGEYLRAALRALQAELPDQLVDVRGLGLWCAIELAGDAQPVVNRLQEAGILVGSVLNQAGTVRIMPPLVITYAELDQFVSALRAVLTAA